MIKEKPGCITMKELSVKGMMKNSHLAQDVKGQNFYSFKQAELKKCGSIRKNLKSSDRTYRCHGCGFVIDRDRSASINLLNAKVYTAAP